MERLHKVLAHAGIASRRKCEELIVAQRVRVNGRIVAELGVKVDPFRDRVEVDGRELRAEKKKYIILHKPRGYLSDVDPASGEAVRGLRKPFALDLVPRSERLYAAGRLDANSEGLLLLTNDGDLAHRLTHPRYQHEKEYLALVHGEPTDESMARMGKGIWYEGERLRADSVRIVRHLGDTARLHGWSKARPGEAWISIVLHEGKKHEIRYLCTAVGHPVHRLIRVRIGPIRLGSLRCGAWRELDEREVRELKSQDPQGSSSGNSGSGGYSHRDRRTGGVGKEHDRRPARR
ncbi:MAG: rRNA pseudouridine synthase [Chloroflexi bacterium]|nr:rRNA pseudouridine synthase [Chloroflexota bacterium]